MKSFFLLEPIAKLLILVKAFMWRQFSPRFLAYSARYVLACAAWPAKLGMKIVPKIFDFPKVRSFAVGSLFVLILTHIGALFAASPTIKAVVFDFGGVVATVDHTQLAQFMMDSFPISKEEATLLLHAWATHLKEEGNEMQFWQQYTASLNVLLSSDWLSQFQAAQACALQAIPQTINAIFKLKGEGYQVALLSNVTKQHAAIIRSLGYYTLFQPALLSYEIKVKKPDPRAFRILLHQLSLHPEEILFIDDQNANVQAAESLGIQGIHFIHPETLEEELQNHGIYLQ